MTRPTPIIETTTGRIRGIARRGIRTYRGIPYARAPTGDHRFRAPQAHPGWPGVLDTTAFGPQAVQQSQQWRTSRLQRNPAESEDCLYLNVTGPERQHEAAPVAVWMHPGAFINGAGSDRAYDGTALARGGVVLVTPNYRLGALGWMSLGHLDPDLADDANLGLLDQLAALRWVQENITQFGGDPTRVTVFGESAGAMCIAALLAMPAHRGLVTSAVLQSGAAHYAVPLERAIELTQLVMTITGAHDLAALRRLDARRLVDAQAKAAMAWNIQQGGPDLDRFLPWGPVIDGTILAEDPRVAIGGGSAAAVPMIVGSNLHEWNILDLEAPPSDAELRQWLDHLLGDRADEVLRVYQRSGFADPVSIRRAVQTDRIFGVPATRLADAQSSHQPDTYLYRFDWTRPRSDRGATHASEQAFVFGHRWPWDLGAAMFLTGFHPPATLVEQMSRSWQAFARDGSPAAGSHLTWTPWSEGQSRMHFSAPSELRRGPFEDRYEVWDGLV